MAQEDDEEDLIPVPSYPLTKMGEDRLVPLPKHSQIWPIVMIATLGGIYAGTLPGPAWVWFSWHPLSMMLAFLGATGASVLMKKRGGYENTKIHGSLMAGALAVAFFGLYVIYTNKNLLKKPHFTSWHSWLGLAALGLYLMLFAVGVAGLHPDFGLRTKDNALRGLHKYGARFSIALAWSTSALAFYYRATLFEFLCFFIILILASAWILK